jgi:cullin 2
MDNVQKIGHFNNTSLSQTFGMYLHMFCCSRYLNQQHIKKQKLSDAELMYGGLGPDIQEQMEIGELGL